MMTATKEDLSMCKVTLHKVNTHISGIGIPLKKRKNLQTFFINVMYDCIIFYQSLFFLYFKKKC